MCYDKTMNSKIMQLREQLNNKKRTERSKYSVAITLVPREDKWQIIYQKRSQFVSQPGEISFPGGHVEQGESSKDASIRELSEEMGIDYDRVYYIGQLPTLQLTDFGAIDAHVMWIDEQTYDDIVANIDEVESYFTVPINELYKHQPTKYVVGFKPDFPEDFPFEKIPGGKDYPWRSRGYDVYFYPFEHFTLWGITAKLTKQFVEMYMRLSKD